MSSIKRAPAYLKAAKLQSSPHSHAVSTAASSPERADMPAVQNAGPSDQKAACANRYDVTFQVPFTHRLRFTSDVCGAELDVLTALLDGERAGPAKALVFCEAAIQSASPAVDTMMHSLGSCATVDIAAPLQLLAGGEAIKQDAHAVEYVLRSINEHNLDRRSYIVAIGGGAFLDAVGYAAAIAHRGIRLIRIPTTTLAQADSGVGVKNAINYFGKKNWVGTFAVPWAVINDARLLMTLPDPEFRCGFAEAVKVTALKDRHRFQWLLAQAHRIADRDMGTAVQAIKDSCLMHLQHITLGGDAFEALEARPLDFGHWSAHRLEAMSNYRLPHGEAVAIGVALDSLYSHLALGLPEAEAYDVCHALRRLGLKLWNSLLDDHEALLAGLEEFRQHLGGRLTVTMLRRIGEPIDVHAIDHRLMLAALTRLHDFASRN